jgi:hypothetical protein
MAVIENINVSSPNDGLGDSLRDSQIKANTNFAELNDKKVEKVAGKDLSANNFTDLLKTKLDGIEDGAEVNVQSDWSQTDNLADDYIKNKPDLSQYFSAVGGFDYEDLATKTTPLAYTSGDLLILTNDTLGANTSTNLGPYGVTQVWDSTVSAFTFGELSLGDEVILRVHIELTTSTANQISGLSLLFGEGTANEYTLPIDIQIYHRTAGVHDVMKEIHFYLGNEDWRVTPVRLLYNSDHSASIKVYGWHPYIIRKSINILDIDEDTYKTFSIIDIEPDSTAITVTEDGVIIGYNSLTNKVNRLVFDTVFSAYLYNYDLLNSIYNFSISWFDKSNGKSFVSFITNFTSSGSHYIIEVEEGIDYTDFSVSDKIEIFITAQKTNTYINDSAGAGVLNQSWSADKLVSEFATIDLQSVTDVGSTTTNNITANSFIKDGGIASEFLKADGSVDSNAYLTGTSGWGLQGNADTNSATDFIGTTDNQRLVFRANNTEYANLLSTGQFIIGGNSTTTLFRVYGTAQFGTLSAVNGDTTIVRNLSVVTGTGGTSNILATSNAVAGNTSINLSNTGTGGKNWQLFVGGNNVSGGSGSLINEGNFLIRDVTNSNAVTFIISKTTNNVGIGSVIPTDKLHVVGSARITGAIKDSSNSAGTSGQILSSTATGTAWINAPVGNVGTVTSVALANGTTGTDINISGSPITGSGTITLNIPTASAVNRGALSSADWSNFDGKQTALISGTNIKTINGITLLGSGDITIVGNATHTGDVTGSTTLTIANNSITTSKIANYNVMLVKLPQMDIPNVFVGKYPGAVGSPQYLNFIDKEIPTGLINGVNTIFTMANTAILGSEHLYRNGILQEEGAGNDYTISGATITFLTAPLTGDKLRVTYRR